MPQGDALALVHVVNPFGMSWRRRTNAGNVDLNRNALAPGEQWRGAHPLYANLNSWLNPASPPSSDAFTARAAWLALRHGPRAVKQAVAEGQYDFPQGLFYGGKALAPELAALFGWLRGLPAVTRMFVIDFHTGLGPHATDTLIREATAAHTPTPSLEQALDHRLCDPMTEPSAVYTVRGGLGAALPAILPGTRIDYVLQEIGTASAMHVLHALREENRWYHYARSDMQHPARARLFEALCPADPGWRTAAVALGMKLAHRAGAHLYGG